MNDQILRAIAIQMVFWAAPTQAALIQYSYTGVVTSVQNEAGDAQSNLAFVAQYGVIEGALLSGSFLLDTSTADIRPDLENFGDYRFPTVEASIQIGTLVAAIPGSSYGSDRITIANNATDRWLYRHFIVPIAPGFGTAIFDILLRDSSGTAFASDALGVLPPLTSFDPYDPSDVAATGFLGVYNVPDGLVSVRAEFDSFVRVVPVPQAFLLLFSACSGLMLLFQR